MLNVALGAPRRAIGCCTGLGEPCSLHKNPVSNPLPALPGAVCFRRAMRHRCHWGHHWLPRQAGRRRRHPPWASAVGNALYDASGRRTRRRGPTRRERTTRRTVSYKVSGPDASGMYDASYSVVQGVVQHRHSTTQYDTVRHSTTQYDTVRHSTTQYDTVRHSTTQYDTVRHSTSHTDIYICRHINTCKWKKKTDWSERGKMGPNAFPFWSKESKRGNLKYWHFASTTCRQCLQLAGRVYLWCTVSTDPRPPIPYMRVNDGSGPFWGKGAFGPLPKYWHFASTTCRQCLQLAGRVYLWCTVSTDPRPPIPYMRVNDGSGPFWGKGAFGPLPKYWHFASTTCRQCLQLAAASTCGAQCLQTPDRPPPLCG